MFKKILFLFIFIGCGFFIPQDLHAQKKFKFDTSYLIQQTVVYSFLGLNKNDKVADIGTGIGFSLVPIAGENPKLIFDAEDISKKFFNRRRIKKMIKLFGSKADIGQFRFNYGTDTSTGLPSATYNKVLMFDVLHEITFKDKMLKDIRRILSDSGSIFFGEIMVRETQKKDIQCSYPYLREDELKSIMAENHFTLKKEQVAADPGKNRYFKLFEYIPEK